MFTLTETFEDWFEYEGHALHVDMAFDNILRLFEMFDDQGLFEFEKIPLGLEMLIFEYDLIRGRSYDEQNALFEYVLKEFLDIDLNAENDNQKVMDFKKDAGLIYASFFAVYHMDLFSLHGKLHWKKFQQLLTHLLDESPFKKVIGYRTMKVPNEKEVGKEYRNQVLKMKRIYSLGDEQAEGKAMDNMFQAMDSWLGKGGERNE